VPSNGEINLKFGVYKTLCCDAEIVIGEGVAFPDCPNHTRLTTLWKPLRLDDGATDGGPTDDNEQAA
jgi:hypothetical protein